MKKNKKFTRKIENFTCINCGKYVIGNGYTNHCPQCLQSLHVDINPGDRASACGGIMKPIRTEYSKETFVIIHKCQKCGIEKKIKATNDDNKDLLMKLLPQLK
ncbi:MAG: RNHCP domain-containing protein [Candidatus Lokiarchaeota archaeon]|nr:RNHCP domain-containing protein [Candidatus Lokiarchaeota archaeon]